jgi:hypothetical protein
MTVMAVFGSTRRAGGGDRGAALLIVLLATALLAALGIAVATALDVEQLAAANGSHAAEVDYAADAAAAHAIQDLAGVADWTVTLSGAGTSALFVAIGDPVTPWGETIDISSMTAAVQSASDAGSGGAPDATRWRLFLAGPLETVLPPGARALPYLLAWVGDDRDDDNDPRIDSNGVIRVHAVAVGPRGLRATRDVVLAHGASPGVVRLVSWRDQR